MRWERKRERAKHCHVLSNFASCSGRPRADIAAELSQGPLKKVLMEVMTDNASQDCGTFSSRGLVVFVTRSVVIVLILVFYCHDSDFLACFNVCWGDGERYLGTSAESCWPHCEIELVRMDRWYPDPSASWCKQSHKLCLHCFKQKGTDCGISVSNCPCCRRNLISIGIEAELSVTNNLAFYGGFWPGGACDFARYLTTISKFSSLHNGRSGTDLLGSLLHWGSHQANGWWLVHFQRLVVCAAWRQKIEAWRFEQTSWP